MSETKRSHDSADSQKGRSESAKAGHRADAPDSAPPATPAARNKYHDRPADDGAAGQQTAPPVGHGIRKGIADADKLARTGAVDEPVRDTPPAGAWNDVARNE
jgi:hypothetical protein